MSGLIPLARFSVVLHHFIREQRIQGIQSLLILAAIDVQCPQPSFHYLSSHFDYVKLIL